jgi:GMP synthase (glutamine-hydrolysing)
MTPPANAEILAYNNSGIIDAIRFNQNTWGLQFHPEFNPTITKLTIQAQSDELTSEGFDVQSLLSNVAQADCGIIILKRFKKLTARP